MKIISKDDTQQSGFKRNEAAEKLRFKALLS